MHFKIIFCYFFVLSNLAFTASKYKLRVDSVLKQHEGQSDSFKFEKVRLYSVGFFEKNTSESDSLIRYALQFAKKNKYYLGQAIAYEILAASASRIEDIPLKVEYYLNAMDIYEQYKLENREKITCLINLAALFKDYNCKNHSLEYSELAYKLIYNPKVKLTSHEVYKINSLAGLFYEFNDYKKVFNLIYSLYRSKYQLNAPHIQFVYSKMLLAKCYNKLGKKEKRDQLVKEGYLLFDDESKYNSGIYFYFLNEVAKFKMEDGKIYDAIDLYHKSLDHKSNIDKTKWIAITNRDLSLAYIKLNKFSIAEEYALRYKKISLKNKFQTDIKSSYFILSKIYKTQKRYLEAYQNIEIVNAINDSIYNLHQSDFIESLFAKHKLVYKEEINKDLYNDNIKKEQSLRENETTQKILIFLMIVILIFMVLISYFFIKNRQKHYLTKLQAEQIVEKNKMLGSQNDKLVTLNKEIKGLTGIVSHDLKAPLSRVEALLGLIEEDYVSKSENMNFIKIARNELNGAKELISNILLSSEKQHQDEYSEPYDVSQFLTSILLDFVLESEKKKIKINQFIAQSVFSNVHEIRFRRIVTNLVSNAIKFSSNGDNIYIYLLDTGNTFKLSVKDEGPGLTEDEIGNLFGKYNKLSAKPTAGESSTGLGLFIVKKLIDELDGEIYVQSKKGKGATFDVVLKKNISA